MHRSAEGATEMMTQEEFMDVVALRRQGWTITDIAAAVGRHPDTVSAWLKRGGPPAHRVVTDTIIDEHWAQRVGELLAKNPNLLATSVARILAAEGFTGSYPTLVRYLRGVRGPRRGRGTNATVAIETDPGAEAQADWSDCSAWSQPWALGPVHCFGAILCWSRRRFWWFAPRSTATTPWRAWSGSSRMRAVMRVILSRGVLLGVFIEPCEEAVEDLLAADLALAGGVVALALERGLELDGGDEEGAGLADCLVVAVKILGS
jgi:lambda repressor-like predicted transcriptional regulator